MSGPKKKNRPSTSAAVSARKPLPQVGDKPKRNIPVVPIVLGVIILVVIVAAVLGDGARGAFGDPTISGENLGIFTSPSADEAVGTVAPVVTGQGLNGDPVVIDANGQPTAVVFLAHWCPHCQREVPKVQEWLDASGGVEGVEVVSVATAINSARANYPPKAWLESAGWTPPVLLDDVDGSVFTAFGSGGFPYWVFLNGDGTVAARTTGELDIASLEERLQSIAGL